MEGSPAASSSQPNGAASGASATEGAVEEDDEDRDALSDIMDDESDDDEADGDDQTMADLSDSEDEPAVSSASSSSSAASAVSASLPPSSSSSAGVASPAPAASHVSSTHLHGRKPPVCIFASGLARLCKSTPQLLDPSLSVSLVSGMLESIFNGSPFRCESAAQSALWTHLSSVHFDVEHVDVLQPNRLDCMHAITLSSLLDFLLPGYQQSRVGAPGGSHSKTAPKVNFIQVSFQS